VNRLVKPSFQTFGPTDSTPARAPPSSLADTSVWYVPLPGASGRPETALLDEGFRRKKRK
jgi:hypothetical protein